MNALAKTIGAVGLAISVIAFVAPPLDILVKLLIVSCVLFVCAIALYIIKHLDYKRLRKDFDGLDGRHQALSHQFDTHLSQNRQYRQLLLRFHQILCIAEFSNNDDKLKVLHEIYLQEMNNINDEED